MCAHTCMCVHMHLGKRQMSGVFLCLSPPCYLSGCLLLNFAMQIQTGQLCRELSSTDLSVLEVNKALPCLFTLVLGNLSARLCKGTSLSLFCYCCFETDLSIEHRLSSGTAASYLAPVLGSQA